MKRAFGVALVITSTTVFAADPLKVVPPQQKSLSSENGRFVFGQISDARRDQYMLDTKTGRLWRIVTTPQKNPDGTKNGEGYPVLEPVLFLDPAGKEVSEPK